MWAVTDYSFASLNTINLNGSANYFGRDCISSVLLHTRTLIYFLFLTTTAIENFAFRQLHAPNNIEIGKFKELKDIRKLSKMAAIHYM